MEVFCFGDEPLVVHMPATISRTHPVTISPTTAPPGGGQCNGLYHGAPGGDVMGYLWACVCHHRPGGEGGA